MPKTSRPLRVKFEIEFYLDRLDASDRETAVVTFPGSEKPDCCRWFLCSEAYNILAEVVDGPSAKNDAVLDRLETLAFKEAKRVFPDVEFTSIMFVDDGEIGREMVWTRNK